jgi:para-aminobenzoate synthetase component 1
VAWHTREVPWPRDVVALAQSLAHESEIAWLDSAAVRGDVPARYSLLTSWPAARIEQRPHEAARLLIDGRVVGRNRNAWELWRGAQADLPTWPPLPFDLSPGWIGYLGYELAGQLEGLPTARLRGWPLPLIRMSLFDNALILDHVWRRACVVTAVGLRSRWGMVAPSPGAGPDRWLMHLHARDSGASASTIGASSKERALPRTKPARGASSRPWLRTRPPRVIREMSLREYVPRARRAIEYVRAGDVYQVNLAHRLRLEGLGEACACYAALRAGNPAPYGALLRWSDDGRPGACHPPVSAIASASPELFLRLRAGRVLTRPIKGTRPRSADPRRDAALRAELLASEKDAAELAMIIDLHRNDLGRVCRPGSIRVLKARRLEAHPAVFHTVGEIAGQLAPRRQVLDVLTACFPAGSVTGVPKIRAMEIIHELEPVARGVYTGAIGVVGLDGQMTLNVAIRTLQMHGDTGWLHVGGAIVADSDPADEYAETIAKGSGIVSALCHRTGAPPTRAAAGPRAL